VGSESLSEAEDFMRGSHLFALTVLVATMSAPAHAREVCTIAMDAASAEVLVEQGDCRTRVTPASTFKVPLAVIGFDSGILADEHAPVLPYKEGYVDWGGDNWRQPTDPTRWLKYSVVWYSQHIARALGQARLTDSVRKLGFGNADFSGDPGKNNGLERAWIASSLQVSPYEQAVFLSKLVTRQLPVSTRAMEETHKIIEVSRAGDGGDVHGKTGTAYPRAPDGSLDEAHGYGWYVGWAALGARTLVFARLDQDQGVEARSTGVRTRASFLERWPALAATLTKP
jgi:beta-lactamase class D